MKKDITIVIFSIALILGVFTEMRLFYKINKYKVYVEKTEVLLDSIYVRDSTFDDTIAETDVYLEYCKAYLDLE